MGFEYFAESNKFGSYRKARIRLEFVFKKTNELSINEKIQICDLFEEVFNVKKPIELFEKEFQETSKGYSYHTLLIDDKKIKGVYSAIPIKYNYFGDEKIFALSVDTMIANSNRGNLSTITKMIDLIYEALKKDNINFIYGAPNKNYYPIAKQILNWKDIDTLDYYCLPVKLSGINTKLSFLNFLMIMYSYLINSFVKSFDCISSPKNIKKNISKINNEEFINWRYFDSNFKIVKSRNNFFSYKIKEYNGIRTAYIIDVEPFGKSLIESAAKYVFDKEKNNIDIVVYTGKLDFKLLNLYKVPKKFNPRPYNVSGKILNEEFNEKIFDIANWHLNMSNFDFY